MEDATNSFFLSLSEQMEEDILRALPWNAGSIKLPDTLPICAMMNDHNSNSLFNGSPIKLLEREIADLTGERYTVSSRLHYLDNRISALQQQLIYLHGKTE